MAEDTTEEIDPELVCPECERSCKTKAAKGAHRKLAHGIEPKCGTVGGYLKHRRDDNAACRDCKNAWSERARAIKRS